MMLTEHIEILVEEPSMEAFLRASLPRIFGTIVSFEIYPYQGKMDLLSRLDERLRGYAAWLPSTWRVIVVVDRDNDDCAELKARLEALCASANLSTRTKAGADWKVAFRIAIEELEAWYFGDWEAVCMAYPRSRPNTANKAAYKYCDRILGGTWEALERELQKAGHFTGGLRKTEAARSIGRHFSHERCTSPSYKCFAGAIVEAIG